MYIEGCQSLENPWPKRRRGSESKASGSSNNLPTSPENPQQQTLEMLRYIWRPSNVRLNGHPGRYG